MSKVFISRTDSTVSWGFRLEGGLEYNEPLTVTNVSTSIFKSSPSDSRRACLQIDRHNQKKIQTTRPDVLEKDTNSMDFSTTNIIAC
jgi:hypothetical protein